MTRILLVSDLAATGFGRVGRELATRWLASGHDIRILGINWRGRAGEIEAMLAADASSESIKARLDEMDADPLTERTIPSWTQQDGLGNNLTAPAADGRLWPGWIAERIVIVADPRAFLYRISRDGGVLSRIPTFNYVPIEGIDLPQFWAGMWEKVTPVAMSRFGQTELERLLHRSVPYIPHGVSDGFHPVTPTTPGRYRGQAITSKDAAKAAFGWGGRTVVLRTDRFVPRKDYPALFRAMAPILADHPEVLLVVHCAANDEGGMMPELVSRLPGSFQVNGAWQHPQVKLTKAHDTFRGLSDEDLNVLYNAADVYASPTMAEGFGLTLAEAASVGVPVVTTDYAAGPEVLGDGAVLAKVRTHFTNVYSHEWALVDEDDFSAKVRYLVEHPAKRRAIGEAGRRSVARYSWADCADGFLDVMGLRAVEAAA